MNVLNLRGPEFLRLYFTLLAGATTAGLLLRWWLRQPGTDDWPARRTPDEDELDPAEIAYLMGGPNGAADAAITRLVHEGTLKVKLGALALNGNLPRGVGPVERAVYRAVAYNGDGRIRQVRQDAAAAAAEIGDALQSCGLVPTDGQSVLIRCVPMFAVLAVVVLGLVKCGVGASRGRPIGFLVMASLLGLFIATLFVAIPPRSTRRGA